MDWSAWRVLDNINVSDCLSGACLISSDACLRNHPTPSPALVSWQFFIGTRDCIKFREDMFEGTASRGCLIRKHSVLLKTQLAAPWYLILWESKCCHLARGFFSPLVKELKGRKTAQHTVNAMASIRDFSGRSPAEPGDYRPKGALCVSAELDCSLTCDFIYHSVGPEVCMCPLWYLSWVPVSIYTGVAAGWLGAVIS